MESVNISYSSVSAMPGTEFLTSGGYLLCNALFDLVVWHRFAQTNVMLAFYAIVVYVNFEETANPLMSSDLIFFRHLEHSSIKNLSEIDECFENQISNPPHLPLLALAKRREDCLHRRNAKQTSLQCVTEIKLLIKEVMKNNRSVVQTHFLQQ